MSRIDDTVAAKKEKRQQLEKKNILIHPYSFDKKDSIESCRTKEGQTVKTAGRLMTIREHGKVAFADLLDSTAKIQLMFRQQEIGDEQFELLNLIDAGDHLGVEGEVVKTKTGEITILVKNYTFLGKSLRPLPTQWNAAEDKEVRFRKRYLDMLVNPTAKRVLDARWQITKEIRRYLQDQHGFIEVETPILQVLYGGTNAKPFTTHMNALDSDFYLRIAPELYLKRLIVGGYEKIFEIARNFRNEGIDQTHQPEFSMIEWYEAYADYKKMMSVAEGLVKHLVKTLYGGEKLTIAGKEIDVSGSWPQLTMAEAIKKYVKIDLDKTTDKQLEQLLEKHKLALTGEFNRGKAIFSLFDHLVTEYLIQPTWIIDYPKEVSPLSKLHRDNPNLVERFEGYIAGKEIGDGWSEITDSIDQRSRFESEQKAMRAGDEEAHPTDEDFLEMMEYGMPPLGGIGIGIDRLVMFLTDTWSIKEVIAFPTLKAKTAVKTSAPQMSLSMEQNSASDKKLPSRDHSIALLETHIKNEALRHHCYMVATVMQAYAEKLGEDKELWFAVGLLHDLDYEEFPSEHPSKAIAMLSDYPVEVVNAVLAHAPALTGREPSTKLEKYLFACDELSGLIHAVSLMRPNGFADMQVKSVKKKLKDKSFAAKVSREDIAKGFELVKETPEEHIEFLIKIFQEGE